MAELTYALGRDCTLSIDGVLISSAQDVQVREFVSEVDATAFQSATQSAIQTHRTWEVQATIADIEVAKTVSDSRLRREGIFLVPNLVTLTLQSGLFSIDTTFTIGDIQADEPLDGLVLPRFTFRQFGEEY